MLVGDGALPQREQIRGPVREQQAWCANMVSMGVWGWCGGRVGRSPRRKEVMETTMLARRPAMVGDVRDTGGVVQGYGYSSDRGGRRGLRCTRRWSAPAPGAMLQ